MDNSWETFLLGQKEQVRGFWLRYCTQISSVVVRYVILPLPKRNRNGALDGRAGWIRSMCQDDVIHPWDTHAGLLCVQQVYRSNRWRFHFEKLYEEMNHHLFRFGYNRNELRLSQCKKKNQVNRVLCIDVIEVVYTHFANRKNVLGYKPINDENDH